MSIQAVGWVLEHSATSGTDRLVLISLANHAGQSPVDGAWESWPGVKRIAREAGLARTRTVQESLARMEADGLIARVVNGAPDSRIRGDRRPNLYRIILANGVTGDGIPSESRGDASRTHGVTPDDITGCRDTAPEPSLEPSVEPSSASVDAPQESDDRDRGFDVFWERYPKRSGKRIGKAKALTVWRKLTLVEKRRAYRNLSNYSAYLDATDISARDAERYLRGDWYQDFDAPPETDRQVVADAGLLALIESQLQKEHRP